MSREGAGDKQQKAPPAAGTPIWVWLIYALGLFAGAIFAFSILFTLGAKVLADDLEVTYDVSTPATLLWGALVLAAAGTWYWRRRQRR